MRKRLWQLHSWCGLITGLGLLLIGLSGSILVFHAEVDRLLDPRDARLSPPPGAARLNYDELFARVRAQLPDYEIAGWQSFPDRREPDIAAVERRGDTGESWVWIKVDPYEGRALVEPQTAPRKRFTDWLLDLHVSMFLSDWGTVLNGVLAVVLCFLGISGLYLYRDFWRCFFRLRWRASARIFRSDLHKAIGISSVAFNLVLGFTGAYWNLPTLGSLFGHHEPGATLAATHIARLYNPTLSVESFISRARAALPGLRTEDVYMNFPPRYDDISIKGRVPTRNPLRTDFGGEVTFDKETGQLKKVSDIRAEPLWTQIEDMMTPAHFGTFGGLPIKILWCAGGLTPGALAVSGALIWRVRRRRVPR